MDPETASLRSRLLLSAKRAQKSCGPCRTRKVKCNRAVPCVRCIKSGYPDLCLYDERARRSTISLLSTQLPNEPSASAQRRDSQRATHVVEAPDHRSSPTSHPEQSQHQDQIDKHPYLGANSLPQFLDNDSAVVTSPEDATRQRARDAMMPMLGVAPSVPGYPFYTPSEKVEEHAIARLLRSLPPSRDIIR
jgi:hypothetical protein